MANWMLNREEHPGIIPFLHAVQCGYDYNIVVSVENAARPSVIINPTFTVKDKKSVKQGVQGSESFMREPHVKKLFYAERSELILLKYDEYRGLDEEFIKGSEEYEGEYAVLLQEICDIAEGKLITRFPEIVDEIEQN